MSERVAVVGAGVMGTGIAQVLATSGFEVVLHDVEADQLQRSTELISTGRFGLDAAVGRGLLSEADAAAARSRLRTTSDLAVACADVALVVEAVYEQLAVKVRLFKELDRLCPPHAVLTSNTAGLPITALAEVTSRPGKVLGWHWSQPVPAMRMAEIIRHGDTEPDALDLVVGAAKRCGKNPVVVNDRPEEWGFVANRIMRAVRRESARVVADGVATEEQVDELMKDCFRWPMGPFEMQGARRIGEERQL